MPTPAPPRPLVLTSDERLLDDLLRLAAAAGVDVQVEADIGVVRQRWHVPPAVFVGMDVLESLLRLEPARRDRVVVLAPGAAETADWRRAVALGAEHVLLLPGDEAALADLLADVAEGADRGRAVVVGCVGGRGGAGASVLSTALALAGVRGGHTTMLVDADPYGGGIDLMLGAERSGGLRWPDLAGTRGRVAGRTLREHLPDPHGLTVLSWDRGDVLSVPVEAARAVISAARRSWDVVVIDLPRHIGPAQEELLAACDTVLLVVPAEVRAIAAAGRVAAGTAAVAADVRLVVRGPAPSGLTGREVVAALNLPLAAQLEPESGLEAVLERGLPPTRGGRGPLATACADLIAELVTVPAAAAA